VAIAVIVALVVWLIGGLAAASYGWWVLAALWGVQTLINWGTFIHMMGWPTSDTDKAEFKTFMGLSAIPVVNTWLLVFSKT
jgi:hypothetical protein